MRKFKILLIIAIIAAIAISTIACDNKKKVNITTEEEAIEYLKEYIEKKDRWDRIALELSLSYSIAGSNKYNSFSHAEPQSSDVWLVVLQGTVEGYTDHNMTRLEKIQYSYVALVASDGEVSEVAINRLA